ncbi:MAG TPA: hypothetical protein VEJ20_10340, partial [Candidatus Eremiobacteraceae bacterium]|nr:hypothetical protein [Candidatus Eremiobacteraceae bacterium]
MAGPSRRGTHLIRAAIGSAAGLWLALAAAATQAFDPARAAGDPPAAPAPSPSASISPQPIGLPLPPETSPAPTFEPSPSPSPTPAPVAFAASAIAVPLGHAESVPVLSPASGILALSGFDPAVATVVFDGVDRTIDVTGLHAGVTTIVATDLYGQAANLTVTVEPYAGKAYDTAAVTITGDPAGAQFVAEQAAHAANLVAYPVPGATVIASAADVADARELPADDIEVVHVPVSIEGPDLYPYHQSVTVMVRNLAQPQIAPKYVLVSDFPETITQDGTLFYADVNPDAPVRLLYYHFAPDGAPLRRVLVKVQNNGVASSFLQLTAGIGGPDQNVLLVGHESTKRFLVEEAAGEGQIFEVPPDATINLVDQLLPASELVSGLMQVRVVDGDGVRLAVVVQDALDSPVEPISDTLLSSAVEHARGIYQVPDFDYDEDYIVGAPPTVLDIGKLPLPNLVQGDVLGGDYGVKQSATVTLENGGDADASVGMWLEPRG